MTRTPTMIRHPDDLDTLSAIPGLRMPGSGPIRIEAGDELDPKLRQDYERRLNRHYFACGCDKAALGMVVGVVGYIGWMSLRSGGWERLGWPDLWLGLAVVVAATAAGKFIGRVQADRQLKAVAGELRRVWKAPSRPTGELFSCG